MATRTRKKSEVIQRDTFKVTGTLVGVAMVCLLLWAILVTSAVALTKWLWNHPVWGG